MPGNPWSTNNFWVRLSTTRCLDTGAGWTELDEGPAPPDPGYAPVDIGASPFTVRASNLINYTSVDLGDQDVNFPQATQYWDKILQVGIWGHRTSTAANYFIGGFEIPGGLDIVSGESLSFKSNGKAADQKGIRVYHVTPIQEEANGINAGAENSIYFNYNWGGFLNVKTSTYPTLTVNPSDVPGYSFVAISEFVAPSWTEELATGLEYLNVPINTNNFEIVKYSGEWLWKNKVALEYSPVDQERNIRSASVGASYTEPPTSFQNIFIAGGRVDSPPVVVAIGEIPVIEVGQLSVSTHSSDPL